MFFCRPWLIVFGPRPPQRKSPSFTMLHGRDMFLVSDSCSMLNHVKPQLCVLVLACQAACSTVGACLTSRFHALSAKQTCKQLRFPSEVVSGDVWGVFFSSLSSRGGGEGSDGTRGIGRQGCRAAAKRELCLALGGTVCAQVY